MGDAVHPCARTWRLPEERPPSDLFRTNLRTLAARPGRFEHHLMVVARIGEAQLECATASEPLYFAHANVSDEYVVALPTGDALIDSFPFRVFVSDTESGADVARINHRVGDLVLHPYGFLHWPGRLRPPFDPPPFPPGMRRAGLSLVFCASSPIPPTERPLFVGEGRKDDVKSYVPNAPPFLLAPLATSSGVVARIGSVSARIAEPPFMPKNGGYALVLDADERGSWPCDLIHVPSGACFDGDGVRRALLFESELHQPDAPPPSWERVPEAPFAPLPADRAELPFSESGIHVREVDARVVEVRILDGAPVHVPRYWLARMLFRIALHGYSLGYVETYGGFFWDDRGETKIGVRGQGHVAVSREIVERMYRAVAPPDYAEELR